MTKSKWIKTTLSIATLAGVACLLGACAVDEPTAPIAQVTYPKTTIPVRQPVVVQQPSFQITPPTMAKTIQGVIPPAGSYPSAGSNNYTTRQDVADFVYTLSAKSGIPKEELFATLAQAKYLDKVVTLNTPRGGPGVKDWASYQKNHIDNVRIAAGAKYARLHAKDLQRAEQTFGVPQEVILGIIGVETIYGRTMGDYRALDVLTTLAFDFPRRADFFKDELENFLVHSKKNNMQPTSVLSSFAGALGIPQFMPSSWIKYGVDFDNDGKIDLRNSHADAIGSVANYLKSYGWIPGQKPYFNATFTNNPQIQTLLDATILPKFTINEMQQHGVTSTDNIPPQAKLALIDLPYASGQIDYVLGGQNFYVVTRYNRSNMYAMSVLKLGDRVQAAR